MSDQFVVPQFIDVEDKIIGPVTVRQFVIMLVDAIFIVIFYKLFDFALFLLTGIPLFAIGVIFAWAKINGQPFHYFVLNVLQTFKRPGLRIWDKNLSDAKIREILKAPERKVVIPIPKKESLELSHLSELSLVVNTGGVYKPEEN